MVILDVDSQRLLNVRREIAQGTLVHPSAHVILQMSVQIPLVGRPEFAQVTFYHRHRMILDVFGVPSFHVRDVIALDAAEKLAGKCLNFL